MKYVLESVATWTSVTMLSIVANFDPEVLQWPGGSVVAMLLAIYATIAAVFAGPLGGLRPANCVRWGC